MTKTGTPQASIITQRAQRGGARHEDIAMIEIEKNIPLPPRGARQGKYPFAHMEVGDSFFVRQTEASKNSVISSVQWAKGKFGFRFTVRADNDNAGWRVWRVA